VEAKAKCNNQKGNKAYTKNHLIDNLSLSSTWIQTHLLKKLKAQLHQGHRKSKGKCYHNLEETWESFKAQFKGTLDFSKVKGKTKKKKSSKTSSISS